MLVTMTGPITLSLEVGDSVSSVLTYGTSDAKHLLNVKVLKESTEGIIDKLKAFEGRDVSIAVDGVVIGVVSVDTVDFRAYGDGQNLVVLFLK